MNKKGTTKQQKKRLAVQIVAVAVIVTMVGGLFVGLIGIVMSAFL